MKPPAKLPLVLVVWLDAWTNELGVTVEDVGSSHKAMEVHTLGWLLKDDDKGVSLANEYFDDSYRGRTFIPRGMVVSVTHFALTKARKTKGVDNGGGESEKGIHVGGNQLEGKAAVRLDPADRT